MKEQKKKKKLQWGELLIILFFILNFISICILAVSYHLSGILSPLEIVLIIPFTIAFFIPLIYLAIKIQAIIHEGGHLICGLISGYRFASFRISSYMFVKKDHKIKLKRFSLMGTSGQCLMIPPEPYQENIPYLLYNLGGSLANLIFSGLLAVLYINFEFPFIIRLILSLSIYAGILLALFNAIPLRFKLIDNDGQNALTLKKSKVARRCFWIQLKINGLITDGVRLRDMPDEWFVLPEQEQMDYGLCASIGVFACIRAIDAFDFETAKRIGHDLLNNASGLLGIHRHMITAEMIFCDLISGASEETINQMFTKEFKKFLKTAQILLSISRMIYAYELLLYNDKTMADLQLAIFEKTAKTYPHQCEIDGERELIAYVDTLYRNR